MLSLDPTSNEFWSVYTYLFTSYEGESVNRSQMDIKLKTCDIRTWMKHLFLDIFSTNIDTLVPLLYQCVETRSIEVFWLLSQSFPHIVGHHLRLSWESFSTQLWTALRDKSFLRKQVTFLHEYLLHWVLLPTNTHNRTLLFGSLTTETSLWTCACTSAT
jgi:hypothetical protein